MLNPSPLPAVAIVYVRVSSADQVNGFSLDTQERACLDHCARRGWSVTAIYREEGESAKTAERTELQRILVRLKKKGHGIGRVVVYDMSRFTRAMGDYVDLTRLFAGYGVRLALVTQPSVDETPDGVLMGNIFASLAEHQNAVLREKTSIGMREAFRRGVWPWQAPYGYLQRRTDGKAGMVHDPARAPFVLRAFERMASGSVTQEQTRLETIPGMSRENFSRLLRNPLYCGRLVSKTWGITADATTFAPIVPADLFDRVQGVLSREASGWQRSENVPEFPLRQWTRCTSHGAPLTAYRARGRNGTRYPYYRCTARPACLNVRAERVDDAFRSLLQRCAVPAELVRTFAAVLRDVAERDADGLRQRRRAAELRIRTAQERQAKTARGYFAAADVMPLDVYRAEQARIAGELQAANTALADLAPAYDLEPAIAAGLAVLETPIRAWETVAQEHRHRFVRVVFPSRLHFNVEEGFRTPFRSLFVLPSAISRGSRESWYPDGDRSRTDSEVTAVLASYGQLVPLVRVTWNDATPN